jgi:hypothetical protein
MRIRFGILVVVIAALATVYFSPFLVGGGLRLWAALQARRQGIHIKLGKIDAPILRPVTIREIHITDARGSAFQIDIERAVIDLNLGHVVAGLSGRSIRSFSMEKMQARVNRGAAGASRNPQLGWATLERLLPGKFNITNLEFRIEDEDSVILLRNASISGSEIEAGRFSAGEFIVTSPFLHQTFSHLRGATKWQDNRLTLGGITLSRGLDLLSLVIDVSRIGKQRADFQFDLDTFGGKIRASFADEWRPAHSLWSFVGSANDISLAQTSEALGFADKLGGSLRACKFTFRGDPRDLSHATASIWTELTDLNWRDRAAETIMLGAAVYNRQLQLQQLFVKQRDNQLTLSGDGSVPSKPSEWLNPDFRGNISGSVKDLGAFASLFGAQPGDFAGTIAIEGTMNARDRKIGGHLTASGKGLSIFKTRINEFTASLNLKASQLEIEQLDFSRKQDWLHAQGKIDIGTTHNYSGSVSADVKNLSEYLSIFGATNPSNSNPAAAHFQFAIESGVWNGSATITPTGSRPVDLGVISLPLWIGENWNEFSIRPLNVILSFPLLSLDKSPRWLGFGVLNGGILSGGLHLSGTLRNPKIDGDLQLLNGKTDMTAFGITGASGRIQFAESHGSINFLRLTNKDVDLSFTGEAEMSDPDQIAIILKSNLPMLDLSSHSLDCASQITFTPVDTMFGSLVTQLEFRGSSFDHNWMITLRPAAAKSSEPLTIDSRTVRLCLGAASNGQALNVGTYSPVRQPTARQRKRARRR